VSDVLIPVGFAVGLWWSSTGAILWLVRLPDLTFAKSMTISAIVLVLALFVLARSSALQTTAGVYAAFTSAVIVWGVQEMAFLMGYVTGPRKTACTVGCRGWQHFRHGAEALLYHELLLISLAVLVAFLTWDAPNQVAVWTFLLLWVMRLSAKLNLFLGVPNSGSEMLPHRLRYLESFLTKRPMNPLFPFVVTVATSVLAVLIFAAAISAPGGPETIGLLLIATLLGLAILEHWLMVLPLRQSWMWSWALRAPAAAQEHVPCSEHQSNIDQSRNILRTPANGAVSN